MFHKVLFILVCIGRLFSLNAKDITTEMCERIDEVKLNKSFIFFPLGLSHEESKNLNLVKVEKSSVYGQAVDLNLINDELPLFLQSIGNDNPDVIASITRLIFRITNSVKDSHHKENAWLMVLAFVPTDNYNIPRWHIDPFYFLPEETPLKFIATLKGPSTLFYFLPEERRKEFALLNPYHHENWRDVFDPSRVTQAKKGEGAFFITGNMDRGAVHSEPPIHEERLIFSVIPANEEELEMLRRNWKK